MDIVGSHRRDPSLGGQQGQGVVAGGVDGITVVPQLHGNAVTAEPVDQLVEDPRRCGRTAGGEGGGERSLSTAGEDLPMTIMTVGQVIEGDDGPVSYTHLTLPTIYSV